MTLEDLIYLTDENTNIRVFDMNSRIVSVYDGKREIDERYNKFEVDYIRACRSILEVTLDCLKLK